MVSLAKPELKNRIIVKYMIYYSKIKITELKRVFLIAKNKKGVCEISFSSNEKKFKTSLKQKFNDKAEYSTVKLKSEIQQLHEYFAGKRKKFSMKLYLKGTDFQKNVWRAIANIGYGKTASYYDIAKSIKNPNALRAVGTACGKNPLPIVIPCHRIISKYGGIGGFGGGVSLKKRILLIEKVKL
jgi:O-6-methylguanine DNA methyltransferase